MILLLAAALLASVAAPPVVAVPSVPVEHAAPPPTVYLPPRVILLDLTQLGADARRRVEGLNEALKPQIIPVATMSNALMEQAVSDFRRAAAQPMLGRNVLLAAAAANDRARHLPIEANLRWTELALSLPPTDRDRLLAALPTPSGLLFLRPALASGSPAPVCAPSDDVRATPTMSEVQALMRMLNNPSIGRLTAKQAEQEALRRARATALDSNATSDAVEAAFAELGAARAALAREDAAALGRLMTNLPIHKRCTILSLLPSASTP